MKLVIVSALLVTTHPMATIFFTQAGSNTLMDERFLSDAANVE